MFVDVFLKTFSSFGTFGGFYFKYLSFAVTVGGNSGG